MSTRLLIVALVLLGVSACGDEDPVQVTDQTTSGGQGGLVVEQPVGECRLKAAAAGGDDIPPAGEECLEYEWDGQGHLVLRHLGAALNCCPQRPATLTVVPGQGGDSGTITLDETVVGGDCDCLCLFDLEFSLSDLPSGSYEWTVLCEDVGQPDPDHHWLLELAADQADTDLSCVERNVYPWPVR